MLSGTEILNSAWESAWYSVLILLDSSAVVDPVNCFFSPFSLAWASLAEHFPGLNLTDLCSFRVLWHGQLSPPHQLSTGVNVGALYHIHTIIYTASYTHPPVICLRWTFSLRQDFKLSLGHVGMDAESPSPSLTLVKWSSWFSRPANAFITILTSTPTPCLLLVPRLFEISWLRIKWLFLIM